ncbi:hypothetical protein G7Z17_g12729 [Cylindrodendrum hubeiense]|uniref:SAP domain-containing protein n=1 Tax=Cylindrodendrum hubeiense TaxID=595255 RepID=A0A9P5GXS2_9HYPO|nr:hypothetical protein G7Z17_g12729 [Cylindrodendrum hubeiense]
MTDWAKLRVVDLKDELRRRGLPYNGLKGELVARLIEAENEPAQDEPAQDEPEQEDVSVNDESSATEPVESEIEVFEVTAEEPVEDVASKNETKEDQQAPLVPDETEESGTEEGSLPEETKNGISDDAPLASTTGEDAERQPTDPTPADEPMQDAVTETNATNESSISQVIDESIPPPESQESQKRKRRSLTPPPSEEAIARKRARPDDGATNGEIAPQVRLPEDQEIPKVESQPEEMKVDEPTPEKPQESTSHEIRGPRDSPPTKPRDYQQEMDYERDVAPSVHPATSALYIKNFMRPLRPNEVQAHLAKLAMPSGDAVDDDIIVEFFLDQIRTHAFVVFKSTLAASRVRLD